MSSKAKNSYGLHIWADNNFIIKNDKLHVNYKSSPSILEIVKKIRERNIRGPIILRFPHIIQKQISSLYKAFNRAITESEYKGIFKAVYPLKVNHFPEVVKEIVKSGKMYRYGFEAGSKAELVLAMSQAQLGSAITLNGFKDEEIITLGFSAAAMGHNITLTIEGIGELESIIDVAKRSSTPIPNIGIRIRLHSRGSGVWAKSSGMQAKFGLTSTELLEAFDLLQKHNLLAKFTMLHFHIGSQMQEIAPLKRALREAGNIYAELKKMGAASLCCINIGGGLCVEYAQHDSKRVLHYSLREAANDVVYVLCEIMNSKGVEHPDIMTESGRLITASHALLATPVLELFSQDYQERSLRFKEINPPLIEELKELNDLLCEHNCIEYLHDALDHIESLLTLFELGYIDLRDRSNAEILVHTIIKKALYLSRNNHSPQLKKLQESLQERYLTNCSFFQSMPDFWGLGERFPVVPLHHLDKPAICPSTLWDITCDSDGEIEFDPSAPLYLHDIDLDKDEYFLAFFNIGAYQETLGMNHNLFTHPTEASIGIDGDGYEILNIKEASTILQTLQNLDYDPEVISDQLKLYLQNSNFIGKKESLDTLSLLEDFLSQNGYLRTTK